MKGHRNLNDPSELPCTAGRNVKCAAALENGLAVPQAIKHVRPRNPSPIPQRNEHTYPTETCTLIFITALLITPKDGNNTNVHQWTEQNVVYPYNIISFSHKKE